MNPVTLVARSKNRKLGAVAATYVSQQSCPRDCPFLRSGCYAESGPIGVITHRLNRSGRRSPKSLALAESKLIASAPGDRPLRVHVVGDCRTNGSAQIVSRAMANYPNRSWTYTHAWRKVHRRSWGKANVLASCESIASVRKARRGGYATVLTVPKFQADRAYNVTPDIRLIPCPNQTRGVTCAQCRLCWDAERLRKSRLTIGFALHGNRAKSVNNKQPGRIALEVL